MLQGNQRFLFNKKKCSTVEKGARTKGVINKSSIKKPTMAEKKQRNDKQQYKHMTLQSNLRLGNTNFKEGSTRY